MSTSTRAARGLGFLRLVAILVVGGPASGCSSDRARDTARAASEIRDGTPTTADHAVAALVLRRLACGVAPPAAYCTGTLIAPRVLLTAAHCLEERRPGDLGVFFGVDTAGVGSTVAVVAAHVHPGFDPATGAHDLALLVLETPSAVTPVVIAHAPPPSTFVGSTVRVVGFGLDETGATGRERTGTAKVSALDGSAFRYVPDPSNTCGGDSGGPVFFDDGAGEKLIGVTRSGDADCVQFGTALRVDDVLDDFIAPVLAGVASTSFVPLDTQQDHCASPCTGDADCPVSMICLEQRGVGRRCGFPGLQSGRFGAECKDDASCGNGACVALLVGEAASCRCFAPCTATASVAQPSTLEPVGACHTSRAPPPFSPAWLLALTALAASRRRRRRSRPSPPT